MGELKSGKPDTTGRSETPGEIAQSDRVEGDLDGQQQAGADGYKSGGLLQRWSRNKAQAQSEQRGQGPDTASTTEVEVNRAVEEDPGTTETDAPAGEVVLTDEDMPPLDTLDSNSDYSGFLNKGVSPELRKQALQHLFRMPKFNLRDGLNDYDEDYTVFEPLGDTITSDMRWHAARKEREEREAREAEEALASQQETMQTDPGTDEQLAGDADKLESGADSKPEEDAHLVEPGQDEETTLVQSADGARPQETPEPSTLADGSGTLDSGKYDDETSSTENAIEKEEAAND